MALLRVFTGSWVNSRQEYWFLTTVDRNCCFLLSWDRIQGLLHTSDQLLIHIFISNDRTAALAKKAHSPEMPEQSSCLQNKSFSYAESPDSTTLSFPHADAVSDTRQMVVVSGVCYTLISDTINNTQLMENISFILLLLTWDFSACITLSLAECNTSAQTHHWRPN